MLKTEFTLHELLRIALGAPKLKRNNLDVLYVVLKYLLIKLNCHNEVVTIGGVHSYELLEMLPLCQPPQHQFDDRNVEKLCENFRKLDVLEKRCAELTKLYNTHFRREKSHFPNSQWEFYTMPIEGICDMSDSPRDKKLRKCDILESSMLINKLRILAAKPIIRRLLDLEKIIDSSRMEMRVFKIRNSKFTKPLDVIGPILYDLRMLNLTINDNQDIYEDTVDEINAMLVAKLDRLLLPGITLFLRKQFDFVEKILSQIDVERNQCPRNKAIHLTKTQCLCCGTDPVNVKKTQTTSIMRHFGLVKCTHRLSNKDCMVRGKLFQTI